MQVQKRFFDYRNIGRAGSKLENWFRQAMFTVSVSLTAENVFQTSPISVKIWEDRSAETNAISKSVLAMRLSPTEARDMAAQLARMADAVEKKRAAMPNFKNLPISADH